MICFRDWPDYQKLKSDADRALLGKKLLGESSFLFDKDFRILTQRYSDDLVRCQVVNNINDEVLVDIFGEFRFFDCSEIIRHPNGCLYFLVNAGQNAIINLTDRTVTLCADDGLSWATFLRVFEQKQTVEVEALGPDGMECVTYDFRDPRVQPLPILERHPCNLVGVAPEYIKARKEMERFFETTEGKLREDVTFGEWRLQIFQHETKVRAWDYSRGVVKKGNELLAVIKRNYPSFPYLFFRHNNGNHYLLCGEDYQGYTIVNLESGEARSCVPRDWLQGAGFCWVEFVGFDADQSVLTVCGCVWGAPYEIVEYDLSAPEEMPYRELSARLAQTQDDEDDEGND